MSDAVICRDLWKSYRRRRSIGVKALMVGTRNSAKETRFTRPWALSGVNLSVAPGRALGVLGPNGSGKSSLLSILLGTVRADRGEAIVRGRVASLLELGAGFHGELTGRENVALYGSILGMTLREVRMQFDAIVAFSELESAIDSPMRTYSAGMMVRLGFAVATHARAEVILIDEVLAVGDARFQEKCRQQLRDFKRGGGTLVIVSHNMAELAEVSDDGICLELGQIVNAGPIDGVIADYRARSVAPAVAAAKP